MTGLGEKIVELRKAKDLTQLALAEAVGVSQATISRIESGDNYPNDIRQLAKLARTLGIPFGDLMEWLPAELTERVEKVPEFFAFCPNPLCDSNVVTREDGNDFVQWKSGKRYRSDVFEEINFCDSCGEELVKDCPSCKRTMTRLAKYCVKCGEEIYKRPSVEEWKQINSILTRRHPKECPPPTDDIPF